MRVLVASIGFGSGHNRAAEAAAEKILREFPEAEVKVVDFLNWEKNVWDRLSESVYFTSLKYIPSVYHSLYKAVSNLKVFHPIIFGNYVKKMERYLKGYQAEIIISTHVFCAKASSVVKKRNPGVKSVRGVLTDFMDDRYWNTLALDKFFVATEELKTKLVSKGIPEEAVAVRPIPVRKEFHVKKERAEACKAVDGLDPGVHTVLILGGGNGLGGLAEVAQCLVDLPVQIIVVAGINIKVRERLDHLKLGHPNLFVFGYVSDMHDLMDASDVCVTKPGGVTIAECLAKKLPIIVYGKPLPGPETENIDYLVKNSLAGLYTSPAELREGVLKSVKSLRGGLQ